MKDDLVALARSGAGFLFGRETERHAAEEIAHDRTEPVPQAEHQRGGSGLT